MKVIFCFSFLGLGSTPDCLFVEEEDAEDVNNFVSDDDFVDQGSIAPMCEVRCS